MTPEDKKRIAAEAAIDYVKPDTVVGVGTGSTVNHFIDLLAAEMAGNIRAAVSSSEASSERLRGHGIPVVDLNEVGRLDIYVDGADESNPRQYRRTRDSPPPRFFRASAHRRRP